MKIKILLLFLCIFYIGFGQTSNPFELKSRLDSIYEEVGEVREEINFNEIDSIAPGSTDTLTAPVPSPGSSSTKTNPFDVNHVPIRKSELQKTSVIQPSRTTTSKLPSEAGGSSLIVFGMAMLSLLLIAIVANVKRSLFSKIFKSFTNDNMLKLTQREENNGLNAGFLILYIVFALNVASLIYLLIGQNQGLRTGYWLIFFLVVVGIYLLRHISMFILGFIFPIDKETSQYSFLIAVVNILLGLILIPINLIIAYAPESLAVAMTYIVIGILGFAYIIRSSKGMLLGLLNYGTHLFHFFLYLCTFEIVPVLLIYRVFTNMSA